MCRMKVSIKFSVLECLVSFILCFLKLLFINLVHIRNLIGVWCTEEL